MLGAEFSIDGFASLAQRALNNDDLAEAVGSRSDIPAGVLRALVSQVAEIVRSRMLAAASPEMQSEIASVVGTKSNNARDYAVARKRVADLDRAGQLLEREIIEFANNRQVGETLAALELLCATSADVIRRFMIQIPAEAIPVVCNAAGLSWKAAQAVIGLCSAVGRPLNEAAQRKALANYSKLTRSTSERLLRFWFVRGSNRADHRDRDESEHSLSKQRRKGKRSLVELPGSILIDGSHVADCVIADLSMEGAKLRLSSSSKLPSTFVLHEDELEQMNAGFQVDPSLIRQRRCASEHPFGAIKRMTAGDDFSPEVSRKPAQKRRSACSPTI